jgi:hypothetical protein
MGALIAGGMSMVSGVNAAYDESQAQARARVEADDNTHMALEAAGDAIARGNVQAGQARMRGSRLEAQQRMAYVASGVDPTVGTPTQVASDTAAISELDARTAENNAAAEAWGFRMHGVKFTQQAGIDAARSNAKQTSSILGGAGNLAAGATSYFTSDAFKAK